MVGYDSVADTGGIASCMVIGGGTGGVTGRYEWSGVALTELPAQRYR